ncbi:putative fermentation associated protein [Xylariaceae sp. FL1019]|nr:putative fermentation associated protein [Xylariaceae sp. FL1019]
MASSSNGSPGSTTVSIWKNFNGEFLGYGVLTGILAVFFLLYFNRLSASILSYLLRTYAWRRYRIYIDVQALQFSLLGGRVFFTGLSYHGNNETILIRNGHITWSYWLRRVRDADIYLPKQTSDVDEDAGSPSASDKQQKLPCRINVCVSGLEWFVYNRSGVYDSILDAMRDAVHVHEDAEVNDILHGDSLSNGNGKQAAETPRPRQRLHKHAKPSTLHDDKGDLKSSLEDEQKASLDGERVRAGSAISASNGEHLSDHSELPLLLRLYPVYLECDRAAMVMGNDNTKALLIVKAKSLTGHIDASDCKPPDPYRQLYEIKFEHPVMEMREHDGYKEDQLTRAVRDKQVALESEHVQQRSFIRRHRRKTLGRLRNLIPSWRKSVESFSVDSRMGTPPAEPPIPGLNHWKGLSRYLNADDEDDKLKWSTVEYGAVPTVVDSPEGVLTILWDVPGKVSQHSLASQSSSKEKDRSHHVNGTAPPAWAIKVSLKGGSVNYGPWADRQRAELQKVFFPGLCKDAIPARRLPAGSDRVPTIFNLYLEFTEETILRIPTREDSKNWKWKKEATTLKQQTPQGHRLERDRNQKSPTTSAAEQRPYGWLDVKIGANATVSYRMDMLAGPSGYANGVEIDLPSTEISTSVNHGTLWRSAAQHISCDLSTPLRWNGLRTWSFNIDSEAMELFILREHVFLILDLIDDWGNGPPPEYLLFTPFQYLLKLNLRKLKLYLNVNDVNIINNPTSFEENTFLILSSPCLKTETSINIDTYRPSTSFVPFRIDTDTLQLGLHVPPWNTQATFLTSKDVGHLENLVVDGRYCSNATVSPANTDTLILDVVGQSPTFQLHGFLVRYFLQLKDNYFGDYVHFKTLDEYQQGLRLNEQDPGAELSNKPPPKKSNDLDVMLSIRTDDPRVFLPANLYTAQRSVPIEAASLSIDLRFTNYYMDLDLRFSPLSLSLADSEDENMSPTSVTSRTQMFIDGLAIYGHRLFGLPPSEPTYLCNWDLNIGAITGETSTAFLTALAQGGKAFGFSLDDDENALIPYSSIVSNDITFLRVYVDSIQLWVHVEESAFLCSVSSLEVNYNDWARSHYSRRADVKIPDLELSCVESEATARYKSRLKPSVPADLLFRTNLHFALIGRKYDFAKEREVQQRLVQRHDQRTHRTEFLLIPSLLDDGKPDVVDPPAQSVPTVPGPILSTINNDQNSVRSHHSVRGTRGLRHKSSFMSIASSTTAESIRRGSSNLRLKMGARASLSAPKSAKANRSSSIQNENDRHDANSGFIGSDRQSPLHTMVAFTSQFYAPYFPLEAVQPDVNGIAKAQIEANKPTGIPDFLSFGLEDIDPDNFAQDCAHQSLLFEMPTGFTFVLNDASLRCIGAFMRTFQPTEADDIMDTLQMGAISDIFGMQKQEKLYGSVTDVVLRLPRANISILNGFDPNAGSQAQEIDHFNVTMEDLAFALRVEKRGGLAHNDSDRQSPPRPSFHFRLNSLDLTIAESISALGNQKPTALVSIERVMSSMGSKEVSYTDGDVRAIRIKCSPNRVEHLTRFAQRTTQLISQSEEIFSKPSTAAGDRLKYFTHRLITEGQQASDPSFVIRPSAILRAATRHLRTYDSWKLITRLRYIWTTLGPQRQESVMRDCLGHSMQVPTDVRDQVVAAFDHWRSWDLEDTGHAVLLDNIFGKTPSMNIDSEHVPWMAVCRVREIEIGLDSGPKHNNILIDEITVRIHDNKVREDDSDQTVLAGGSLTIVNLYCGQFAMNLNWELYELLDRLSALYSTASAQTPPQIEDPVAKQDLQNSDRPPRSLHFVLVTAQGSISLDTINLSIKPHCNNLRLSVLNRSAGHGGMDTNITLNCDAAELHALSHAQTLASLCLTKPSVIVTHEMLSVNQTPGHIIRAAASSKNLTINIKKDPIVLAEVVDLLVKDEAAQLHELQQKVQRRPPGQQSHQPVKRQSGALSLDLATFLDSYTVTVPLLRSLTYHITGTVARATVCAIANKQIIFDFDVKENSHDFQIRSNKASRSISLLQIPPTNGRVTAQMTTKETSVNVFASLELVQLDASAVYSLLSALNRPEISNAIKDLEQQVIVIREHIDGVFDSPTTSVAPTLEVKESVLTYNVHGTMAGVKISGHAPIKSSTETKALLSFYLDRIHFEVANKVEGTSLLESPEVHLNIRKISFEVMKGSDTGMRSCGNVAFGVLVTASTRTIEGGSELRCFDFKSDGFVVNLSSDTVSTFVDVLGYLGDKFKGVDTSRELEYLRKLRQSKPRIAINDEAPELETDIFDSFLSSVTYSLEIRNIQFGWLVATTLDQPIAGQEDLILSVRMIEFASRKKNSARLTIEDFQLQMVPPDQDKTQRSPNSALLPEMVFNVAFVSTPNARRLAFQAVGKSLDLRLTSAFIVPAAHLKDSITLSIGNVQRASQHWTPIAPSDNREDNHEMDNRAKENPIPRSTLFGNKRLESILVDADFAGAVVHLSGRRAEDDDIDLKASKYSRPALSGKYGQFSADETGSNIALRTPGLAWKTEYRDDGNDNASLHGEVKIEPSRNVLFPSVVPLVMEISSSIKEVVSNTSSKPAIPVAKLPSKQKTNDDENENILTADPSTVIGHLKLNLGLRICRQEFTMSCQPIGRVAATARFDDIYLTVNTVHSQEHGNFFTISGILSKMNLAVQHVYSRESTGSFHVDSVVISLMNSKHVSDTSGLSAITKMSPMKVTINAKQVHDFLLFREIWLPTEIRQASSTPVPEPSAENAAQAHLVQRYQQVAATAAFPWTATISISALDVAVDLGQSLGKPEFAIKNFWVSSKKTSGWEQNLCLGFEEIGIECDARMSGFITLQNFQLRTSIEWPARKQALNETPRIQASISFSQFKMKAAFDYQAFFVADITSMEFLMYNVRQQKGASGDRLVAIFDGEAVQVFGITGSAAQGAALWKAIQKFIQERKTNYETSLRDIEKYMKRRSIASYPSPQPVRPGKPSMESKGSKSPISLDTDVVVTLRALNLGVFPSSFSDHQVFKLEALNARARFAASMENQRIHSILGLTLGQLRIGLASVRGPETPRLVKEIKVEHVVRNATGSRGGTILKVPKVEAVMETWQRHESRVIRYKFKSAFEGKVEVGWNYSRISYIRGMWANHSKMLAAVWGREIPAMSAIKVTGVPEPEQERKQGEQQKITAEVNVPQSKYEYEPLEPPIIETPQLRDMGEATPPLEWIGLHRERLPNVTHQIVIVSLLELAGEVEDAYAKILGSS